MKKVLIIEDEESIVSLLKYAMQKEGYTVDVAFDGYQATEKINSFQPDVILLDIMLPNKDGYQLCREFCHDYPIIMLTAKGDIVDKVAGIEMGADDYITKPFDIREVMVRIRALLRRKKKADSKAIKIGVLTILPEERRVTLSGEELELTPLEYKILSLMAENKNKVFSRDELLDRVWGYQYIAETRSVDIHIQRLRKKLGKWAKIIKTVYGRGYQLTGDFNNEDTK